MQREATETPPDDEGLISGHPTRPLIYSSRSITERRQRILREARYLIAEHGVEKFGIRELCRRAGVAQRTLYNAFQNKDRIIALAIREAYEGVNQGTTYSTSPETLDGILDRLIAVNRRNFRARNYTSAVTALYFSPSTSGDILQSLQSMAFLNLRRWLNKVEADGELAPWVVLRELEVNFVNTEYCIINDWARGRIPDEDYIRLLIEAILVLTLGSTTGQTWRQAQAIFGQIRKTGKPPEYPKPVLRRKAPSGET